MTMILDRLRCGADGRQRELNGRDTLSLLGSCESTKELKRSWRRVVHVSYSSGPFRVGIEVLFEMQRSFQAK